MLHVNGSPTFRVDEAERNQACDEAALDILYCLLRRSDSAAQAAALKSVIAATKEMIRPELSWRKTPQ